MRIRRLLLCRSLSKGSKVGICNVYLAAFDFFYLGLWVLVSQSELSTLSPALGLLIDSPGYEVDEQIINRTDKDPKGTIPADKVYQACPC